MGKILKKYTNDKISLKFNIQSSNKEILFYDMVTSGIQINIKNIGIKGNNPFVEFDISTPESICINDKWKFHKDKKAGHEWKIINNYLELTQLKIPLNKSLSHQKKFAENLINKFEDAIIHLNYFLVLKENKKSLPSELFQKATFVRDKLILENKRTNKLLTAINSQIKDHKKFRKNNTDLSQLFMEKALLILDAETVNQIFKKIQAEEKQADLVH